MSEGRSVPSEAPYSRLEITLKVEDKLGNTKHFGLAANLDAYLNGDHKQLVTMLMTSVLTRLEDFGLLDAMLIWPASPPPGERGFADPT